MLVESPEFLWVKFLEEFQEISLLEFPVESLEEFLENFLDASL